VCRRSASAELLERLLCGEKYDRFYLSSRLVLLNAGEKGIARRLTADRVRSIQRDLHQGAVLLVVQSGGTRVAKSVAGTLLTVPCASGL